MYSLHTYIKTRGGKCLSMFYALASLHKAYIILHKIYLFLAKSIHVLRILKAGERHAMHPAPCTPFAFKPNGNGRLSGVHTWEKVCTLLTPPITKS